MRSVFAIIYLTLALGAWSTLDAQDIQIPRDMSNYLGDPDRGSEPDPDKEQGQWRPSLDPAQVSTGHPILNYGHFRLKDDVIGKPWGEQPFIIPVSANDLRSAAERFEVGQWKDGSDLWFSFMAPDPAAAKPKDGYPLVIYCPGSGGVGKKSLKAKGDRPDPVLMWATDYYRSNLPAYVLHPHPQSRTLTYEDEGVVATTPVLDQYIDLIKATIAARNDIDRSRIYLMGFSMGGSTTWQLLLREPDLFAAASPAAGSPPKEIAEIARCKDVPIWMFMGNQDPWSGSAKYIHAYQNLIKAGAEQVRFWEIQDMAHRDTPQAMLPLAQWMFAQRKR